MKRFSIISSLVTAISLILSACAAEAAPTINPADVQSTAVAAAFTIVAETQAAIPTDTALPPTETASPTPMATDTPISLPTLEATSTTVPVSSPSGDPCATRVLSGSPKGRPTRIRIINQTKVEVTVSVYLNETASHGECGYRSYIIAKSNDVVIDDLVQGCYNLWAWSNDPLTSFQVSSVTSCINNADKWTFEISTGNLKFVGP